MLGVVYHDQGRFAEAEEAFEEALKINPTYTEAALNLSVTYNDRGKYAEARDIYMRVLNNSASQPRSLDPFAQGKLANMHAELGEAYQSLGLYAEAVRELQAALDLCPSFVDIRTRLGNVLRDMGLHDKAIREYKQVKDAKPDFLPARLSLGLTYYASGQRDMARAEVREVLERDPGNKVAQAYMRMLGDKR
jgi:tetratricopeptide (TPR) repeat protein